MTFEMWIIEHTVGYIGQLTALCITNDDDDDDDDDDYLVKMLFVNLHLLF